MCIGELATLAGPHRASFERPYGWGWLLKLAAELNFLAAEDRTTARWHDELAPLAQAFADRFIDFLPRATYPIRGGAHSNSAFALLLALDYCEAVQHRALHHMIGERANLWFGRDRRYPADYEPSGDDFLSGGLVEAALMRRVVDGCSFADLVGTGFGPDRRLRSAPGCSRQASVTRATRKSFICTDSTCRARGAGDNCLPELDTELKALAEESIERHLAASLQAATQGEYVGTHWLASFALLALT